MNFLSQKSMTIPKNSIGIIKNNWDSTNTT